MSSFQLIWQKLNKRPEYDEEVRTWNDGVLSNSNFDARKRMIKNLINAILKFLGPLAKASFIGLTLDLVPYLIKIKSDKWSFRMDRGKFYSYLFRFQKGIFSGNWIKKWLQNYPKRDSWVTVLVSTVFVSQLLSSSSSIDYPLKPTQEDLIIAREIEYLDKDNAALSMEYRKKLKLNRSRAEFELVVKQFLSSLLACSLGVYLLRYSKFTNHQWNPNVLLKSKHHLATSLYVFVQALHSLWTFQKIRTKKLNLPWEIQTPWLNFNLNLIGNLNEILLFGWASYQVMMSWFYRPDTLPRSYVKWINRFADIDSRLLEYLRGLESGKILERTHSMALVDYCRSIGANPRLGDPYYGLPSCQLLHPMDGNLCSQHTFRRFISTSVKAFIAMYFPLNLFTFILKYAFKKKKQNNVEETEPKPMIEIIKEKVLFPSLQSSAFLGIFVATMFGSICFTRNSMSSDLYSARVGSTLCGLVSILVEAPSRRLALTLYLLPRALASAYYIKILPYIPPQLVDTPLLTISLATLLTCFKLMPESLQPPLRPLLKWIYDVKDNNSQEVKGWSPSRTPTPEPLLLLENV